MREEIIKLFAEMKNEFDKVDRERNNLTREEFAKFEPLFRKDTIVTDEDIRELTEEFFVRIDPYLPINILEGEKVILTLPAVFLPMKKTKDKTVVDTNINSISSDNVRFASKAVNDYSSAILLAQFDNNSKFEEYKESTAQYLEEFNEKYSTEEKTPQKKIDYDDILDWE
jgi:hypothetical protein